MRCLIVEPGGTLEKFLATFPGLRSLAGFLFSASPVAGEGVCEILSISGAGTESTSPIKAKYGNSPITLRTSASNWGRFVSNVRKKILSNHSER